MPAPAPITKQTGFMLDLSSIACIQCPCARHRIAAAPHFGLRAVTL
jgi:hypothetical protein